MTKRFGGLVAVDDLSWDVHPGEVVALLSGIAAHIELAAKDRPITRKDYWNKSRRSVTASFNCRPATDSTSLSQHSYGWAIDINPVQNPFISSGKLTPPSAESYRDRSQQRMGMIHDGDIVVRSFAAIGWEWGGDWHTLKDYMHFSLTGR